MLSGILLHSAEGGIIRPSELERGPVHLAISQGLSQTAKQNYSYFLGFPLKTKKKVPSTRPPQQRKRKYLWYLGVLTLTPEWMKKPLYLLFQECPLFCMDSAWWSLLQL